jgi:hypothetical protein
MFVRPASNFQPTKAKATVGCFCSSIDARDKPDGGDSGYPAARGLS